MTEEKLAIFVDAENLLPWIQSGGPERLLKEASSLGQAIVRRAYGKWTNHNLIPQGAFPKCAKCKIFASSTPNRSVIFVLTIVLTLYYVNVCDHF